MTRLTRYRRRQQQQSGHINIKKKLSVKFEFIFLMHYLEKISTTFYEIEFKTKKKKKRLSLISHDIFIIVDPETFIRCGSDHMVGGWWSLTKKKTNKRKGTRSKQQPI